MKLLLTTDFHVGYRPKSHVTTRSASMYQDEVRDRALEASQIEADARFNLGDLFDKFSNSESVIRDGIEIVKDYSLVLSGNHDVRNIEGSISSIKLVNEVTNNVAFTHERVNHLHHIVGNTEISICCHYFTQKEFEEAIREVCKTFRQVDRSILFLHCNVGDNYGQEITGDQSTLVLHAELQELVCARFDKIFVGHEHNRSTVRGKIHVLGNHFPLSFGEMVDKYVHRLDTETMELEEIKVWDASESYQEIDADLLLSTQGQVDLGPKTQFVDIVGKLDLKDKAALAKAMVRLWKDNPDTLLAVRNSTEVTAGGNTKAEEKKALNFLDFLRAEVVKAGYEKELEELDNED